MTFWILAFLLIVLVVITVLWPLIRGDRPAAPLARAVQFYEDRRIELVRQRDAGEISAADCEAALAEQARTLLALGRQAKSMADARAPATIRRRKLAALAALVMLPVLSIGLYLKIGAPQMPDAPLVARKAAPQNFDIATALQKIEAHLAKNPNDGRGYEVVAPVYLKAERFGDAAYAYRRVVELLGETAPRLADLGESLVAEKDGIVTAEARQAFERAAKLDPDFAKPKFYLALAREQDGDIAGAFADLQALEASLPEGPSRMRVRAEIERFEAERRMPPRAGQGDAAAALAGLPPAERDAAIRGMVEALDARIADQGGTLEEWRRLVQARLVLGERDKAEEALAKARIRLAGNGEAQAALDALSAAIKALPATKPQ